MVDSGFFLHSEHTYLPQMVNGNSEKNHTTFYDRKSNTSVLSSYSVSDLLILCKQCECSMSSMLNFKFTSHRLMKLPG